VLVGLAACNPVETWRDLTGASRNDPDPATTPNSRNLAAGEAADYPNLATVPPPPTRAMTAAERQNLTQSLVADRANARYSNEQLRAGFSAASSVPPPPGAPGSEPAAVGPGSLATDTTAPPPAPMAPTASARLEPATPITASPKPAPPRALPPVPVVAQATEAAAPEKPAAPPSDAPAGRARLAGKRPESAGQGLRKQGEPPEPGPMESSLEVPQARATPQPEQMQPPPPPPQLPPTPQVAAAPVVGGGLAVGGALAPIVPRGANPPAAVEAPPAPPELPPPEPTRAAAAGSDKAGPKPAAPVAKPIAEIKFGADATSLSDADRRTLETVVPLYRENPGKVRIVGYAAAGSGAVEQLDRYRTALDRAQAVAAALSKAGIPSDKIQVEAAPSGASSGESRAEVLLER
jgi:outer membrane protein OmpA-like peptidoglycan-associated protein